MKKTLLNIPPIIIFTLASALLFAFCATVGEKTVLAMEDRPLTADIAESAHPQAKAD